MAWDSLTNKEREEQAKYERSFSSQKTATSRRTDRQQVANKLDLDMFRLAGRLRAFGEEAKDSAIVAAANRLESNRNSVREYMHRKDREETQ